MSVWVQTDGLPISSMLSEDESLFSHNRGLNSYKNSSVLSGDLSDTPRNQETKQTPGVE